VSDPHIEQYKTALKQLGLAVKSAHKTKEGKKLPSDYWVDVIKMLKKAKLGISMMELGIDDESEISITHNKSDDSKQTPSKDSNDQSDQPNNPPTQTEDLKSTKITPTNESTNKFYDTMNHLGILLSEKFDSVSSDGTEFVVDTNDRKFTIKFDDKFFMVSEDYNFELGEVSDIQNIVNTFVKLSTVSHENLVREYNQELV